MSQEANNLARARTAIEQVLGKPGKRPPLELALDRAEQWVQVRMPSQDSSRGGSSHPTETEEAQEDAAVARLAAKAVEEIPQICRRMERDALRLYDLTVKLASTIDPTKNPNWMPRCKSCARTATVNGETIGDHYAEVRADVASHELCDWCYRNWLEDKELPPIEVLHVFHTQSKHKAGRMMAELQRAKAPKEEPLPPACASEYTHEGLTLRCIRAVDHDGEHAGVRNGGRVTWPKSMAVAS